MPCTNPHARLVSEERLLTLEEHQKHNHGRHKCCQCAYNVGFEQGLELSREPKFSIDELGHSQASVDGRHRSVHQAFALGYSDGVAAFIESER